MMVLSSLVICNYGNYNLELLFSVLEYEYVLDFWVKKFKYFFFKFLYLFILYKVVLYIVE